MSGDAVIAIDQAALEFYELEIPAGVSTRLSEAYRKVARPDQGAGITLQAAAVALHPLGVTAISDYLRPPDGPPGARWDPVLAILGTAHPAAQALTSPLMLSLARSTYEPRPGERTPAVRHPPELPDPGLADRAAVEGHLFDAFLAAAYRPPAHAGRRRSEWPAARAAQWLGFLAGHLELDRLVERWNAMRKFPFTVQIWSPQTGVRELFATDPDVYRTLYGQDPPGPARAPASVFAEFAERLRPPVRLPDRLRGYLEDLRSFVEKPESGWLGQLDTGIERFGFDESGARLDRPLEAEVMSVLAGSQQGSTVARGWPTARPPCSCTTPGNTKPTPSPPPATPPAGPPPGAPSASASSTRTTPPRPPPAACHRLGKVPGAGSASRARRSG